MSWVKKELQGIDLGDKRLVERSFKLLDSISNNPNGNLPEACGGWAETKAAYRFFENDSVTAKKILQPHIDSTIKRMSQQKVVLLLQDTTQLKYSNQHKKEGIGPLGSEYKRGLLFHPTIAITPQRLCLGIVDDYHWHRGQLHNLTKRERSKLNIETPITEKESYRWIKSYQVVNALAQKLPQTQLVNIADREGDIYDLYAEAFHGNQKVQADWLIRAVKNRPLLHKETGKKSGQNILEALKAEPENGFIEFTLPKRGDLPSRKVRQVVKSKSFWLYPPAQRKGKIPCKAVKVNAVIAKELDPPKGHKAIEWFFITSLPIKTMDDLQIIFQYYLCRWQIEVFFRVLKSGCHIEKLQLTTQKRMSACLAMYLITAWRILFITLLDRSSEKISCEIIFDKEEWQMLYVMAHKKKPPKNPPQLTVIVKLLAKSGGFLGRKGDKNPGPTPIWKGLAKLREALFVKYSLKETYG